MSTVILSTGRLSGGTPSHAPPIGAQAARALILPYLALSAGVLGGCTGFLDELVDVEAPSRLVGESFENPQNAPSLLAGAIGDFECAFAHYIVAGGLMGDELQKSRGGGQTLTWANYDKRDNNPAGGLPGAYAQNTCDASNSGQRSPGVYTTLSTARWQMDNLARLLTEWSDAEVPGNRTAMLAQARAYGGYAYVLMGEAMCQAAFDLGPALNPSEIFELAAQRFAEAFTAAQGAGSTDVLNMARVGRARALLNLGRKSEAATDARAVPGGFVFNATYSTTATRRRNYVFESNHLDAFVSVEDIYRDFETGGMPDPRVAVENTGQRIGGSPIELWLEKKYTSLSDPIPLATWEEAQLIVAEAEGGQAAVDIINDLHARAGLPPFESSDPATIQQQIVRERKAELFLQSHHLGDLRRYGLPLLPPPGSVYPFGGEYGDQSCFPLPNIERTNNRNIG